VIYNATLQRIDVTLPPTSGGDAGAIVNGPPISVRCCLDTPNFSNQYLIDQAKIDADAVLFVEPALLPNALNVLVDGVIVTVLQDGLATPLVMRLERASPLTGGMPHVRCFVKRP
jgi:hypothetical protein